MRAHTVVPSPGCERKSKAPPTSATRSRMPTKPNPSGARSDTEQLRSAARGVGVGEPVKAVAAQREALAPRGRNGYVAAARAGRVEGGVEARSGGGGGGDRGQTLGLMQRRQRRDRLQLGAQPIVDPRRRAPVAAVHDPVRDGVRRAQRDRVRRLARPGRRRCRGHRTRGSRALVACVEQVQLDAAQRGGARRRRDLGRRRRRASAVILACEDYRDGAPGARRARTMLNPRLLRESRRAAVPACG